jgi:hypothetical protein
MICSRPRAELSIQTRKREKTMRKASVRFGAILCAVSAIAWPAYSQTYGEINNWGDSGN